MIFAASNIAWPPRDVDAACRILADAGFTGLEIAPGLLFDGAGDPVRPTDIELEQGLAPVRAAGLHIVSMQSLLFGVAGASLFGEPHERETLIAAMRSVITLAGRLGAGSLVFGSPRQRIRPEGMSPSQADAIALDVFRRLADDAAAVGSRIAMEFNPPDYGGNFICTAREAIAFAEAANHPGLGICLDIGALHMTGEFAEIDALVASHCALIAHVHISEPHLAPAPAREADVRAVIHALQRHGYQRAVSIEMRAGTGPDGPEALMTLRRSVDLVASAARSEQAR